MKVQKEIREEIVKLYNTGASIAKRLQEKDKTLNFHYEYQEWYTLALGIVKLLSYDRYEEFKKYYEIDPKRKTFGYGTYVIQDYLMGVVPGGFSYSNFDSREQASRCLFNQVTIFKSILSAVDNKLYNVNVEIFGQIQDTELGKARELIKISPRAAGVIAGVIIEGHLQNVADNHGVKITKKSPTIADLNDLLKNNSIYDTSAWRKVSYLADIRNLCSHKKEQEPKIEQVEELIDGAFWITSNIV